MAWMMKRKSKLRSTRLEALGAIPVKNRHVSEQRLESGELVIFYPVTAAGWMERLSRWLGAEAAPLRTGKLQLDLLGSSVWAMFDGQTPLRGIAAAFAREHQLELVEAEAAVSRFVRELGRRGLVGLR
jgi:hypothetical protein